MNIRTVALVGLSFIFAIGLVFGLSRLSLDNNDSNDSAVQGVADEININSEETVNMDNQDQDQVRGVDIEEFSTETITEGTGDVVAEVGNTVEVHYVGTLVDGTKFDSSRDRGQTFSFGLGSGQVIQGWDVGVAGMKVGEVRKLNIPSEMGYGERGAGATILPGSGLVFEVELISIN